MIKVETAIVLYLVKYIGISTLKYKPIMRILTQLIILASILHNAHSTASTGIDEKAIEDGYKNQMMEKEKPETAPSTTVVQNNIGPLKEVDLSAQQPQNANMNVQAQPIETGTTEKQEFFSKFNPFGNKGQTQDSKGIFSRINPFTSSKQQGTNNTNAPTDAPQEKKPGFLTQTGNDLMAGYKKLPSWAKTGLKGGAALAAVSMLPQDIRYSIGDGINAVGRAHMRRRHMDGSYGPYGQYGHYGRYGSYGPYGSMMANPYEYYPPIQQSFPYAQQAMPMQYVQQPPMPYNHRSPVSFNQQQQPRYVQHVQPPVIQHVQHPLVLAQQQPIMQSPQFSPPPQIQPVNTLQPTQSPCLKVRPYASLNEAMQDIQAAVSAQLANTTGFGEPAFNPLNPRQTPVKSTDQVIYEIANRKGSFSFPQIFLTNYDEAALPPPRGVAPANKN